VRARAGAEVAARIMLPATEVVPMVRTFAFSLDVAPGEVTDSPAIVTNKFGKGRSVYFAGDVSGAYGKFGDPSLRKLLRNAVRWANGSRLPLEVAAPLAVEARLYRQGGRYVLHLMNYITSQLRLFETVGGPIAEDVIPVHDIVVRFETRQPPKRAYMASNKQSLKFEMRDGILSITVPSIGVHDMLVIE